MDALICSRCNCNPCVAGWSICPTCYQKRLKLFVKHKRDAVAAINKGKSSAHDRSPYRNYNGNYGSPEHRLRRNRSPEDFVRDEEDKETEPNSRTQYHGDNYVDE